VHGRRHESGGQSQSLSQPRLRSVPRFHTDQHHRQSPSRPRRQLEDRSQQRAGAAGVRARAPRQAQLRLDRARHAGGSRHGIAEDSDQDRHHPGLLPGHRAGLVDVMFTGPPAAMGLAAGGKGKILAVASPSRSSLMPQVPTMQEAGVPGYELSGWFGLVAPAKTPQHVVDRLAGEVKTAVADGKFKDRLGEQGLDVVGSSSAEMLAVMRADPKEWSEVIAATGAKVPQ